MNAAAPDAPKLALAPTRPKRSGWYSPVRPGPGRRTLAAAAALGVAALALWLVFGIEGFHDHDGKRITRTLAIDDSGQLREGGDRVAAPKTYRGTQRQLRYAVVRSDVELPASASELRIRLDLPAGVEPRDVVLRARTPAAVVQLRRTQDDVEEPFVDVTRVRSGDVDVDVLIALPSEGLLVDDDGGDAPRLATATRPYDDHVVDEAASGRRLAQLHEHAVWLVIAAVLLGLALPLVLVVLVRRRWYQSVPQLPADAAKPAGPPSSTNAVAAAAITRGSRGVSIPDTFAAQVLELVARDAIKLRHTMDPRTGEGSVIGIGTAVGSDDADNVPDPTTLDGAALLLLAAVANDEGDTVQLPDRADRLTEQLAQTSANRGQLPQARAAWRSALERQLAEFEVVEHMRTRYLSGIVLALAATLVVSVAIGLFSDLDGTAATAWFVAASALAPTGILAALVYELRGWVRVRADRRADRLRWVAWREVLDDAAASGAGSADLRVLPYAVASGNHTGIAPRRAGPTDVGLAAATPELITSLRRVGGARD